MTTFPITATVVLKGLIRPVVLMNYVRVNVRFYGNLHDSSGLYTITKQVDNVSDSGYTTTLTLLRTGTGNSSSDYYGASINMKSGQDTFVSFANSKETIL